MANPFDCAHSCVRTETACGVDFCTLHSHHWSSGAPYLRSTKGADTQSMLMMGRAMARARSSALARKLMRTLGATAAVSMPCVECTALCHGLECICGLTWSRGLCATLYRG